MTATIWFKNTFFTFLQFDYCILSLFIFIYFVDDFGERLISNGQKIKPINIRALS